MSSLVRGVGMRWLGVAVAVSSAACGGTTFSEAQGDGGASDSGSSDGSTSDSAPSDAGSGDSSPPLVHGCPTAEPDVGSACIDETLQCEYGDSWWSVSCDPVVQCMNGQWQSFTPSYEPCRGAPGPNPASCPAKASDVPQGGVCSPTDTNCYYPTELCQCLLPEGPIELDASVGNWTCLPGDGCPYPRPPLGSACSGSSAGLSCTYEACSYGQSCVDGAWQGQPEACASAQ